MNTLKNERLGKFTAHEIWKLFVGGKGETRKKYIFQKAQEKVLGIKLGFIGNRITDHGIFNEYEALERFAEISGFNVEYLQQEFFAINEDCGATPDAAVKTFDGKMTAVVDAKCPVSSFFEQKMLIINDSLPEYQNCPRNMFYQMQMQMISATIKMGYQVDEAYLVRYLTSSHVDDDGNKYEFDLPLSVRLFYKYITADKKVQEEIIIEVMRASKERDEIVEHLIKVI